MSDDVDCQDCLKPGNYCLYYVVEHVGIGTGLGRISDIKAAVIVVVVRVALDDGRLRLDLFFHREGGVDGLDFVEAPGGGRTLLGAALKDLLAVLEVLVGVLKASLHLVAVVHCLEVALAGDLVVLPAHQIDDLLNDCQKSKHTHNSLFLFLYCLSNRQGLQSEQTFTGQVPFKVHCFLYGEILKWFCGLLTGVGDAVSGQFLAQQRRVEVLEGTAVAVARSDALADDFNATVRRVVDPFALLAVVVADVVRVLLFKLLAKRKTRHEN